MCTPLGPSVVGFTCNTLGDLPLSSFFIAESTDAAYITADGCANLCSGTTGCQSFAVGDGICFLYTSYLEDNGFQSDDSSSFDGYDLACFNCPTITTTTTLSTAMSSAQPSASCIPPAGAICNTIGTFTQDPTLYLIGSSTDPQDITPAGCSALCSTTQGCLSSDLGGGACYTFSDVQGVIGFSPDPTGEYIGSDAVCLLCATSSSSSQPSATSSAQPSGTCSPPIGAICNTAGSFPGDPTPFILGQSTDPQYATLAGCSNACSLTVGCLSWDLGAGTCFVLSADQTDSGFVADPEGDFIGSDATCLLCVTSSSSSQPSATSSAQPSATSSAQLSGTCSPPIGAICNTAGSFPGDPTPFILGQSTDPQYTTLAGCSNACSLTVGCLSWDLGAGTCFVLSADQTDSGFVADPEGDFIGSDATCLLCVTSSLSSQPSATSLAQLSTISSAQPSGTCSPPIGAICDVVGSFPGDPTPFILGQSTDPQYTTLAGCSNACSLTVGCLSWDLGAGTCFVLSADQTDSGFVADPEGDFTGSDAACLLCVTPSLSALQSSALPSLTLPSSALPSFALPSSALPSSALPSSALPSSAIAIPSSAIAIPSSALPSSAIAIPSSAIAIPSSAIAIPSSALPSSAIAIPSSALPSSALPSSAIAIPSSAPPSSAIAIPSSVPASAIVVPSAAPPSSAIATLSSALLPSALPSSGMPVSKSPALAPSTIGKSSIHLAIPSTIISEETLSATIIVTPVLAFSIPGQSSVPIPFPSAPMSQASLKSSNYSVSIGNIPRAILTSSGIAPVTSGAVLFSSASALPSATPFTGFLRVINPSQPGKRQLHQLSFLKLNVDGTVSRTRSCSSASVFNVGPNGQLISNGLTAFATTSDVADGISDFTFGLEDPANIQTTFSLLGDVLEWNNNAFTENQALFAFPPVHPFVVNAIFDGAVPDGYIEKSFQFLVIDSVAAADAGCDLRSGVVTTQPPISMTTSTVCTTIVYTITKCPPTVYNCPIGHRTTETIPLYTTVCPVDHVIPIEPVLNIGILVTIFIDITAEINIKNGVPETSYITDVFLSTENGLYNAATSAQPCYPCQLSSQGYECPKSGVTVTQSICRSCPSYLSPPTWATPVIQTCNTCALFTVVFDTGAAPTNPANFALGLPAVNGPANDGGVPQAGFQNPGQPPVNGVAVATIAADFRGRPAPDAAFVTQAANFPSQPAANEAAVVTQGGQGISPQNAEGQSGGNFPAVASSLAGGVSAPATPQQVSDAVRLLRITIKAFILPVLSIWFHVSV